MKPYRSRRAGHPRITCSFCGDKFRTMKARYKHAKNCTELAKRQRKEPRGLRK